MGFTWKFRTLNWYTLWDNGMVARDFGEFVSDKKMIMERFNAAHTHASTSLEITFITSDKFNVIAKQRGNSETWDDAVVNEFTYIRVNK